MFQAPKHNMSGLMESGVNVPEDFLRQCLLDVVRAVAKLHEAGYVHRHLALNHIFVLNDRAKVGGLALARPCTLDVQTGLPGYKMKNSDYEEHRHGYLPLFSAPEVLLGAKYFTVASDMWSLGCVIAMMILRRPLFGGVDDSARFKSIFTVCGTPTADVAAKWPLYAKAKPKSKFREQLCKVVKDKCANVDHDVLEVLESLLQIDPKKRRSARELLDLAYFKNVQYKRGSRRGANHERSYFSDRCTIAKSMRNTVLKRRVMPDEPQNKRPKMSVALDHTHALSLGV